MQEKQDTGMDRRRFLAPSARVDAAVPPPPLARCDEAAAYNPGDEEEGPYNQESDDVRLYRNGYETLKK